MASIRKSFSLRNGVQVDDDNLIVNANGLVGIGTSIPTETFDVRGTAKVVGLVTASSVFSKNIVVSGIATLGSLIIDNLSIDNGIVTSTSGNITYYGDGSKLLNLPTSQWLDIDVGLGFTSIYAQAGYVGIHTSDPRFVFQIGGNGSTTVAGFQRGVGFNSTGNILATGILTAFSFVGYGSGISLLNASNISSGTLNNSRLPSAISVSGNISGANITGTNFSGTTYTGTAFTGTNALFTGTLIGVANTANNITPSSNIRVNSINSGFSTSGISTFYDKVSILNGNVGVGTTNAAANIHIRKSGQTSILLNSDGSYSSKIVFGRSLSGNSNNAELRFGNTNLALTYSSEKSLDIINYDTGNFNFYLHESASGISTGNFNWIYQSSNRLMTLTYGGKLGVNQPNPTSTLHVVGTSNITGNSIFGGTLTLSGALTSSAAISGSTVQSGIGSFPTLRVQTTSSTYPFQIGSNPDSPGGGLGVNNVGRIVTQGDLVCKNINSTGIVTGTSLKVGVGSITGGDIYGSSLNLTGNAALNQLTLSTALNLAPITTTPFYFPEVTTAQRNSISVNNGAVVYNSENNRLEVYLNGWVGIGTTT